MSDENGVQRDIGRLEARVESLTTTVDTMAADVKLLVAKMNQADGAWRTLMAISAGVGAVAGVVGTFIKTKVMGP
jgi:hypothetical protein